MVPRTLSIVAAILLAVPALAGQPGVQINTEQPAPVVQSVPVQVQTVLQPQATTYQDIEIQCPQTTYRDEVRTRTVTKTRMIPETYTEEEEYTVRVPETVMVPRTVRIACPPEATTTTTSVPCVPCQTEVRTTSAPVCHCQTQTQTVCQCSQNVQATSVGIDATETGGCRLFERLRSRRSGRNAQGATP